MEIVKISANTLQGLLNIIQESKTNMSYLELDKVLQAVKKEHEELNPNEEIEQEVVDG